MRGELVAGEKVGGLKAVLGGYKSEVGRFWSIITEFQFTLPPIIMEVENVVLEDVFSLQGVHFPLPWLWEEV